MHCAPFNATGHPALSLPIGTSPPLEADIIEPSDLNLKLPIGLQIVGNYYDESMIYRFASAWEHAYDWRSMQG